MLLLPVLTAAAEAPNGNANGPVQNLRLKKRVEELEARHHYQVEAIKNKNGNMARLEAEFNRIFERYGSKNPKSLQTKSRLFLDVQTPLTLYRMAWNIRGKAGLLKKHTSTTPPPNGLYSYGFGLKGSETACALPLRIGKKSILKEGELKTLLLNLPCQLGEKGFTIYALARFPENQKLDVWSLDHEGVWVHLMDGFDGS